MDEEQHSLNIRQDKKKEKLYTVNNYSNEEILHDPPGGDDEMGHLSDNNDHASPENDGEDERRNTRHNDETTRSEENEGFGDNLFPLDENTLRVGYVNINGLPDFNDHSKNSILFEAISSLNPGIMGMSEINRCWRHIPYDHRWADRTRGWWESSNSCVSYNRKDCNTSTYQPGGNILLSTGKATHRIISQGTDESGLGRWSWTRYRGKRNITLRVICAYRPCKPHTPGANTVYAQHQRLFNITNDNRCPRNAILQDLQNEINLWKENDGDQIILMMD